MLKFVYFLQGHVSIYPGSCDCGVVHKGMHHPNGFSYSSCRGFSFSDCLPMRFDLRSLLTPCFVLEFNVL